MFFEAKKTQGDFYCMLNSLTLTGITCDSIVFTDLSGGEEAKTIDSLILTSTNGEPDLFRWQIDVNAAFTQKGTYTASVRLSYTSGTSESSAMTRIEEIPVTITVE